MATIVEMINPLTGLPEQVDKLDHTAQEIDDAVDIAPQLSNPNLLDNWYFGNPVNQRGQTSYTGSGYTIDRWASNGAGVVISSDGVTITGNSVGFKQILNDYKLLSGKTVTFSLLTKERNGLLVISLISGSFRQNFTQDGLLISQTVTLPELTAPLECWVYHDGEGSSTLKAAKLELGTTQTLAHQDENGVWQLNEIPDYGEQLLRCQRYFQLYSAADKRPAKAVDCRPVMRTDPSQGTIVIDSTTYYYNTADL